MGWLIRQGFLLAMLLCASRAGAAPHAPVDAGASDAGAPKDAGTDPVEGPGHFQPVLAFRGGAEWGTLWAPNLVQGEYVRPDGSAHVSFYEPGPASRELVGGRMEVGAAMRLPHEQGLFGHVSMALGGSAIETQSVTVAGVSLQYPSQQMFFAFAGGAEFQFEERVFGVGFDVGYAATWDPGRVTVSGFELVKYGSSGPYGRLSTTARLPWKSLVGVVLYAALDGYLIMNNWTLGAHGRMSIGACFELDGSR